jgi:glyceraldehyde-3-phosphate dehydrogenase (NADP+)
LIWPTLLDHVTPEMRIAWEEPFGPVVPIMRVDSVDQAVAHCNANNLALQVGGRACRSA